MCQESARCHSFGPTWGCALFMRGPYMGPAHCSYRSHVLFRWDPHGIHVLFSRDPREAAVLSNEPLYLKKLLFFHYLIIQNIFNSFLHIKIITKFCILHPHVVVLLLFGFGFLSVNSQNILELFIHF